MGLGLQQSTDSPTALHRASGAGRDNQRGGGGRGLATKRQAKRRRRSNFHGRSIRGTWRASMMLTSTLSSMSVAIQMNIPLDATINKPGQNTLESEGLGLLRADKSSTSPVIRVRAPVTLRAALVSL